MRDKYSYKTVLDVILATYFLGSVVFLLGIILTWIIL